MKKKISNTKSNTQKTTKVDIQKIGMVSTESVQKATGKNWNQWVAILNKQQAASWSHKERALFLFKKHRLSSWWQQQVAIGYEIHVGLRRPGENHKGEFSMTLTKTLPYSSNQVWEALCSEQGSTQLFNSLAPVIIEPRSQFEVFGGIFGEVRTVKKFQRIRCSWTNEEWDKQTYVMIFLVARGKNKTILAVQHENLKTAKIKEEMRFFWKESVEKFVAFLHQELMVKK